MECGKFPNCAESNGKLDRVDSLCVFGGAVDVSELEEDELNCGLDTEAP